MQQETRNRIGSWPTMKCAERISPRSELLRCMPPSWSRPHFSTNWAGRLGMGPISSYFLALSESTLFGSSIQQETRNRVGSCRTVKCAERISPQSELLRCIPPSWSSPHFSTNWAGRLGMGPISSHFLALSESTLFGSFLYNRSLAIALEVAKLWSALKEFCRD